MATYLSECAAIVRSSPHPDEPSDAECVAELRRDLARLQDDSIPDEEILPPWQTRQEAIANVKRGLQAFQKTA
jgi:hypothetical protein